VDNDQPDGRGKTDRLGQTRLGGTSGIAALGLIPRQDDGGPGWNQGAVRILLCASRDCSGISRYRQRPSPAG
jgi:hypothetical protein